jgi:hypothetical protein
LGLLLRRAEHSAVPAGAKAHRGGFPDERVRAEEALDQLQADAVRSELSVWDASDGARPGEAADAAHQPRLLPEDGDAGKSADPAPVVLAQDASFPPGRPLALLARAGPDAEAEPYKPDAAQSAERSCAAQASAARQQLAEAWDAACSEPREQQASPKRLSMALLLQKETPQRLAAPQDAAAAQLLPEAQVVQAAQPGPLASRRLPAQSRDAQQALVAEEPKPQPTE